MTQERAEGGSAQRAEERDAATVGSGSWVEFDRIVHQLLTAVARIEGDLKEGMKEVKAELSAHGRQLEWMAKEKRASNGRVGKLEDWREAVERAVLKAEGYAEGARTALVTKGQWKTATAVFGGVGLIASAVGAIVALVSQAVGP